MFQFNMFDEMETPIIILSTKYHKHLGTIKTIDQNSINQNFQMASHQEVSFDVYKELDGNKCDLWDRIVDFKYIYIPKQNIYYEITVSLDENDKTVKHITGKSACEAELSTRKISIECNTEEDIARDDYVPTVLYNKDNPNASLLDRVLHDKCPDYTIGHVDSSIAKLQRTFSCEDEDIYSFLTETVAEELECLFVFDSATRTISVYDLKYWCNECGYRGEEAKNCPKCGNIHYITYGENTGIYISAENYAESLTIEGESDNVFNCLRIEGGDELMTATITNINQNGSNYIYNYSELMQEDMPEELVQKIHDYQELYDSYSDEYTNYTEIIYTAIEDEIYLTSEMMPDVVIPETTAIKELQNLENNLIEVSVQNITTISLTSSDLAVKGMAKVIVDPRYKVEVIESSISDLQSGNTQKTWTGKFVITNNGNEEDTVTSENYVSVKLVGNNYEEYLYQQIQKKLGNEDSTFNGIFNITDDTVFKSELKKYCLDRLKSFESSYQTCLEVLIENGVTNENNTFYDVDLYNTIYVPYYNRILYIQAELVLREQDIEVIHNKRQTYELMRSDIQDTLDFRKYIGEDLWIILSHYLKEDVYKNDNYISEGLTTSELINKAKELYEVGKNEIIKASTLQVQLSSTLNNLLNIKEFAPFKNKIQLGNWINIKVDDVVYKNRLISIKPDYGNKDKIGVLFSNVSRIKDEVSDINSILSQAQSMSKSYGTVSHQASQGEDAKTTIQEYRNVGLNTALYNIVNSNTQDVKFDEHGLSCRKFDDIIDDYNPEQLRIINNTLAFTKDNWKSVCAALGKLKYKLNGKIYEDYGLNADHVIAGKVISGDIYSANYETNEKGKLTKGTHFDLESGDFALADGRIVYDATNQKMIVRNVDLDWKTSNIEDLGAIKSSENYFGLSNSFETPPDTWDKTSPEWQEGKYIWQKTIYTYVDDTTSESQPVCIQGAKGQNGSDGADAITSVILSSQGEIFNTSSMPESTILTCHVYKSGQEIEPTSYLWQELSDDNTEWIDIGTDKSITITLNSFQIKNRIKCNFEI